MTTLYYVHDPMCSWCWAFRPVWQQLSQHLKTHPIQIKSLVGGLAPDSDEPMPVAQRRQIQAIWRRIEQELGTEFNHDFWLECEPKRSTYPACRAVIAARSQNAEEAMILAIQQAYYLRALNPSDEDTLLQLADELDLDFDRFENDLNSSTTQKTLEQELVLAHSLPIQGFPSLVLEHKGEYHSLPIDYHNHLTMLAAMGSIMKGTP